MTRWGHFACNIMGWHKPARKRWLAGINAKCICDRCKKEITQDSHGDWF